MSTVPDDDGDQPRADDHGNDHRNDHGDDHGDDHRHDVGRFPPGIAEAQHLLGAYLYRVDQLVLTAADAQGLPGEVRGLRELLAAKV